MKSENSGKAKFEGKLIKKIVFVITNMTMLSHFD